MSKNRKLALRANATAAGEVPRPTQRASGGPVPSPAILRPVWSPALQDAACKAAATTAVGLFCVAAGAVTGPTGCRSQSGCYNCGGVFHVAAGGSPALQGAAHRTAATLRSGYSALRPVWSPAPQSGCYNCGGLRAG